MSIKLSEIKDDEMLLVGDFAMNKEGFVKELKKGEHEGVEIYTTIEHKASVDAANMLECALEGEANDNMYDDWLNDVLYEVREGDIEKLQGIVDDILSRSDNTSYQADKKVEIDIK